MSQDQLADDDYDDFFDEAPTIVLIRRLIDDAIAAREVQLNIEEAIESLDLDLDEPFVAIGTR